MLKVQIFDEDDMKAFEKMLINALVKAMRVLQKENLIPGYTPPAAVSVAGAGEDGAPAPAPASVYAPEVADPAIRPSPPPTSRYPWETRPQDKSLAEHVAEIAAKNEKKKRERRSAVDICRTVGPRPQGYIPTDEAAQLIGGDSTAVSAIGQWVLKQEVPAVIVASHKPPTKGMPGRLMVERRAVLARNELRIQNRELSPRWRKGPTLGDAVADQFTSSAAE